MSDEPLPQSEFILYQTEGAPLLVNGFMSASTAPGLGIAPRMNVLGKPVVVVE